MAVRRDYYEVLGVEPTATDEELRSAYRRAALRLHPDKNIGREEEAQRAFQELSAAYSVLKEPLERRWYDQHRDAILAGFSREEETIINLYAYFNRCCFADFDEREDGFYTIYGGLFESISAEEGGGAALPGFGGPAASVAAVRRFYDAWGRFCSQLEFWAKLPHDPTTAPNRAIRRAMERENATARDKHREERTQSVRVWARRG